jgi:hypothetical protein
LFDASRRCTVAIGVSPANDGRVKKAASVLFLLLCIAVSVAGAYNVFSDNADVRAQAEELACKEKKCGGKAAALTRLERSPFAQSFTFATPNGDISVRCVRSAIFVGAYGCDKGG